MKIVHISPNATYNDYWGYQDNLLPKYQKKLGHDVTVITTNKKHENGKIVETDCKDYVLDDGVRVIRMKTKKYPHIILTNLNARLEVFDWLDELKPDFIFFHGLISASIFDAIKYKQKINPECVIVQDSHADYNNNPYQGSYKNLLFRAIFRARNRQSIPYVSKVYGVTPWRKKFAEDFYAIPSEKTDVLIMGADDESINFDEKLTIRERIRRENNVSDEDFLIVTGGKIDKKKKIDILMSAVIGMKGVKLLVFGSVADEVKDDFDKMISENSNIIYVGWVSSGQVYDYFFAGDLVFFPGGHSVMWEQACAAKVPCVFEKWEGTEHVNNGGNSDFVLPVTKENIIEKIKELHFTDKYNQMKSVAESDKTDIYLYSKIAEKSLECALTDENPGITEK